MITYILTSQPDVYELRGLSTDTKPTLEDRCNGSIFLEEDTSEVYIYDAENKIWRKL